MNTGKTVFAQVMDFLPLLEFRKSVKRYQGNYKVKNFSYLDQFLCMAFAQLTYRESLRDIETCLRSMKSKLYHMGIRSKISRSTLADANESRDWRIYADFAQVLIHTARDLYLNDDFGIELENFARCQYSRHYRRRTRIFLCYGSSLSRFCQTLFLEYRCCFFRRSCQKESQVSPALFSQGQ